MTNQPKLLSEYDKSAVAAAETVFNQISTVYERQYSYEPPPITVLYHYTSAEGLRGIIENNELWATSAYYLNDSAEMFYGYNVLREVLDQWLKENTRTEDSITLGLARQLRSSFEDLFEKRLLKPIYIACFCEKDNLLSQWRAYGQSGGYSIGFRVFPKIGIFGERLTPEPNIYTCQWTQVEYDRTKQLAICREILYPIFSILDQPKVAHAMREVTEPDRRLSKTSYINDGHSSGRDCAIQERSFQGGTGMACRCSTTRIYEARYRRWRQDTSARLLQDFSRNDSSLCEVDSMPAE
jgi:hypothetical protein